MTLHPDMVDPHPSAKEAGAGVGEIDDGQQSTGSEISLGGLEGLLPAKERYETDFWVSHQTRARFEQDFWETVHIDLRMTDISDFVIAFVPTNIYSVGTVHEIITARNQLKPVLLISPPISYDFFPALHSLTAEQKKALKFYGLKENPQGLPSQWYGNIVGGHNMFDGFGWEHLDLKGADFYERLIGDFISSEPSPGENPKWQETRNWASQFQPLLNLRGGVLDLRLSWRVHHLEVD